MGHAKTKLISYRFPGRAFVLGGFRPSHESPHDG